jgi:hypothetical protein
MNGLFLAAAIPVVGSAITAGLLIALDDHRYRLIILAVQALWVSWLTALALPVGLALIKLFIGILSVAMLYLALIRTRESVPSTNLGDRIPSGLPFRLTAVLLVTTAALGLGRSQILSFPGVLPSAEAGATLLIVLGLLQLGLSVRPIRVVTGIMTMLGGFEVIYAFLEPSLAVLALLGLIHIALAFGFSVLMLEDHDQSQSEDPV